MDAEEIAKEIGCSPEQAFEMVAKVLQANVRMREKNLFHNDAALHAEWSRWAIANHRDEYRRAAEISARTQSSKPFAPLVHKHIAYVKAAAAKQAKAAPAPKVTAPKDEDWLTAADRAWHRARGLPYN